MIVVFVSDDHRGRVREVIWQDEDGDVRSKIFLDDGSLRDEVFDEESILDAVRNNVGSYGHVRSVEISDLPSALKYLGKSSDLVDTLPEVDI